MKMVKSLLLVSAAGLVAVSGAQAADLPVKAKPVEYVKVCSLYGAGFYYIPGTDICMKIGGYVRCRIRARQHGVSLTNLDADRRRRSAAPASPARTISSALARSSSWTPVSRPLTARCGPT